MGPVTLLDLMFHWLWCGTIRKFLILVSHKNFSESKYILWPSQSCTKELLTCGPLIIHLIPNCFLLIFFVWQIVNVLEFIAKKEGLQFPQGFAARIVEKSNRNLRRAILTFESCRVQQLSPLTAGYWFIFFLASC